MPPQGHDKEGLASVGALQEPKTMNSSVFLSVNFGAHGLLSVHWPDNRKRTAAVKHRKKTRKDHTEKPTHECKCGEPPGVERGGRYVRVSLRQSQLPAPCHSSLGDSVAAVAALPKDGLGRCRLLPTHSEGQPSFGQLLQTMMKIDPPQFETEI